MVKYIGAADSPVVADVLARYRMELFGRTTQDQYQEQAEKRRVMKLTGVVTSVARAHNGKRIVEIRIDQSETLMYRDFRVPDDYLNLDDILEIQVYRQGDATVHAAEGAREERA